MFIVKNDDCEICVCVRCLKNLAITSYQHVILAIAEGAERKIITNQLLMMNTYVEDMDIH